MRKRAFSLIEIMVVLAIVALLAGLGLGAYGRYRNNLCMLQSSQRLLTELSNTQQQARTSGQTQVRATGELGTTPLVAATVNNVRGTVECRVYEGSRLGIHGVKKFNLLDDSMYMLSVTATNLPDVPLLVSETDTGLVMEVGVTQVGNGPFQRLFTVPFNPDGTVALPLDTQPGRIIFDNGIYRRQVEISRVGKVKEMRL